MPQAGQGADVAAQVAPRWVYVTTETRAEADAIARAMVRERLAACANIIDGMTSVFWWEGEVQHGSETVLVLKTREPLMERVIERVRALHSYSVPCIVALPMVHGNPEFLSWIGEETAGGEG